jgi:hypothetical protein
LSAGFGPALHNAPAGESGTGAGAGAPRLSYLVIPEAALALEGSAMPDCRAFQRKTWRFSGKAYHSG